MSLPKITKKAIRLNPRRLGKEFSPASFSDAVSLNTSSINEAIKNPINPIPDFNDTQGAYQSKSNGELLRAATCFRLCKIPWLVSNAEMLMRASRRISPSATDAIVKSTLYGQFCAGEDQSRIQPVLNKLNEFGVGSILDYAAESDETPSQSVNATSSREYEYESEAQCDRHVETFKQCIRDASHGSKDSYAAVKVTALGNPKLLARMSQAIVEAKRLFEKFDTNNDGFIQREEFELAYKHFFYDDDATIKNIFEEFDLKNDGQIDYISWSMMLNPQDLPKITATCREIGPLAMAAPTEEEIELIEEMYKRGHVLANEAAQFGTRLLIDAEQVRYQPAIDKLVLDLQRKFNSTQDSTKPLIYNTYQCYLKDASERIQTDVMRSQLFGYHFGTKLVRGAYMESERALAKKMGLPSPIHDTIDDTHKCYDDAIEFLLHYSTVSNEKVEIMGATHNQTSIEKAIRVMEKYGIDKKSSTICFAQLYGMMDHLTFNLGKHGYRAYKYVPYGEVHEVIPYLLRRAQENSAIVGGTASELLMIQSELGRRVRNTIGL